MSERRRPRRDVVLVLGDRAEVAQHVGEVDAEGSRVGADVLLLGEHAGVVLGLLEHPQGDVLARRRWRPARAGTASRSSSAADAAGVTAGHQARPRRPARLASSDAGHAGSTVRCPSAELAEQRAVDRDHPRRAVGHERAALVVDDQAALGLDDDVAHRLVGGLGLVGLAADDLEVVEPDEQGREQREHQGLDDDQAQPALVVLRWRPLTPRARAGLERRRALISSGSTNGVSRTSHTTATRTTSRRPRPTSRVLEQHAGEREDRRAHERRGRDRADDGEGGGLLVLARRRPAR